MVVPIELHLLQHCLFFLVGVGGASSKYEKLQYVIRTKPLTHPRMYVHVYIRQYGIILPSN